MTPPRTVLTECPFCGDPIVSEYTVTPVGSDDKADYFVMDIDATAAIEHADEHRARGDSMADWGKDTEQ